MTDSSVSKASNEDVKTPRRGFRRPAQKFLAKDTKDAKTRFLLGFPPKVSRKAAKTPRREFLIGIPPKVSRKRDE